MIRELYLCNVCGQIATAIKQVQHNEEFCLRTNYLNLLPEYSMNNGEVNIYYLQNYIIWDWNTYIGYRHPDNKL